jgi:Uma2 family endonuclease
VGCVYLPIWKKIKNETEASIAPEICVEIISTGNTKKEMTEKSQLYFEAGAKEVWLCDEVGVMQFFNAGRGLSHLELVPEFPEKVEI